MNNESFYSIIRIVPDPAREEFLNYGVILVTEKRVLTRFLEKYTRIKKLYPGVDEKKLNAIRRTWPEWLMKELGGPLIGNPRDGLSTLSSSLSYQTQLSEPRRISLKSDQFADYAIEQVLNKLFERFVESPRFLMKKRDKPKRKVKTILKNELKQLDLLHAVQEDSWVDGSTSHPVTYTYQNGREVAIDAVDIHFATSKKERAILVDATYGKWADVKNTRESEVEPISVLPYMKSRDFEKIVTFLGSVSNVYVVPEQLDDLMNKVVKDLPHQKPLEKEQSLPS